MIKEPHRRGGHSRCWAAEPVMMIMMMMVMMIIIINISVKYEFSVKILQI
jgi:hypothetical protein